MIPLNDVIRITARQSLYGQEVINTYFYRCTEGVNDQGLDGVVEAFILDVIPDLVALQSSLVTYNLVKADNISDGLGTFEKVVSISGIPSGDTMPSFVAFGFKLARSTTATRNGSKRLAGVLENDSINGTLNPTTAPIAATAAAAIAAPLTGLLATDPATFVPVIVQHLPDGSLNPAVTNVVSGVGFTSITSQVSRKVGTGS